MGPLAGLKVLEFPAVGPVPMCGMLLSDLGATVLRLDRLEPSGLGIKRPARFDLVNHGRNTVAIDLKRPRSVGLVLQLIETSDALIEGFRPGVMERLGLGPETCLQRNPRLVYGRLTGWGQDGPLSKTAGHDLNYIAITGALHAIGRKNDAPTPPLNLLGDYAGGSLYMALGIVSALLERSKSGKGQIVDAAIVDGTLSLLTGMFGLHQAGMLSEKRGNNILDSGSPYYDSYECADGDWIAIAALEDKFYDNFIARLQLPTTPPDRSDQANWPALRALLTAKFKEKPCSSWMEIFEGADCCVSPVLSLSQALQDPHLKARNSFLEIDGVLYPSPAPRFSRTAAEKQLKRGNGNAGEALKKWFEQLSIDEAAELQREWSKSRQGNEIS